MNAKIASDFIQKIRSELQDDPKACLVFDNTVLDKRFSSKIELVRRQYSRNAHRVIRRIGLVSCIYVNPKTGQYWVIDYRIYAPDEDGKTLARPCGRYVKRCRVQKKVKFAKVLMDSWYAAQKLMTLIEKLGKIYYVPLKKNRLVDDTGGQETYQKIDRDRSLSMSSGKNSKKLSSLRFIGLDFSHPSGSDGFSNSVSAKS